MADANVPTTVPKINRGSKTNILIGTRFTRLVVTSFAYKKDSRLYFNCTCDCGTKKVICGDSLRAKTTKGCGCLQHSVTHGFTYSPEYNVWSDMITRCENPNSKSYKNYGERGIKIHPSLRTFEGFLTHVGRKPAKNFTIERINNDKDYEPGNLKWATRKEQAHNRTSSVYVVYKNTKMPIAEAFRLSGANSRSYYNYRKRFNLTEQEAFDLAVTAFAKTLASRNLNK